MGDGGVACVPSQHVMEKFAICGGKTNGNTTKVNSSSKSTINLAKVNPKMKLKKNKRTASGSKNLDSLTNEIAEKKPNGDSLTENNKEEVEEGELGTLPFENGEFVPEKPARKYEIKSEIEKGECISGKWRKSGAELDKNHWNSSKDELEKGEFIPDRLGRSDTANRADEYAYSKARRYDTAREKGWKSERAWPSPSAKERGWKFDRDSERTPPSGRERVWKDDREWSPPSAKEKGWKGDRDHEWTPPSSGKFSSEKEHSRSVGSNQRFRKFSSRYGAEKTQKVSSKTVGEEGSLKNDFSNSKSNARDYSFSNRLKRHGNDSDSGDRKYRVDYDEYSGSKTRKLSDDATRCGFSSDHYAGRNAERPYRTSASSSLRTVPSERHSSRYLESSRAVDERHNSSPHHSERSPHNRARNNDHRDRSPGRRGTPYDQGHQYDRSRSPYDRNRHYDNRYQSPSYVERSPRDYGQNSEGRDLSPTLLERSPHDRGRHSDHRETNWKAGVGEKQPNNYGSRRQEGKPNLMKDSGGRKLPLLAKESPDRGNGDNRNMSPDKTANHPCHPEELSKTAFDSVESSQENGITEEPASMEEDMDICNTPPHVPLVADSVSGKWYYLDHFGIERGPSKLSDLKTLIEEGYLVSDHLIKHLDTDRWVTVEKAVSPLVASNYHSIIPDTITQLVCPPEAPGNLLADNGNGVSGNEEIPVPSSDPILCYEDSSSALEPEGDFHIDDRVGALLQGVTLIPGKEVEMLTGMHLF